MTKDKITKVRENHRRWLDSDEKDNSLRACFSKEDFSGADLAGANFFDSKFVNANFSGADLTGAQLQYSELLGTNFSNAKLNKAWFFDSYLKWANFRGADLRGAKFTDANVRFADFTGANLSRADFTGAILDGAKFSGAVNIPFIPTVCPESGSFIGYKQARDNIIVELEIQKDSKRLSGTNRVCRCDKAKVLNLYNKQHRKLDIQEAVSMWTPKFTYKVGEMIVIDEFDTDRWKEYGNGIYFFMSFQEAKQLRKQDMLADAVDVFILNK